MVSRPLLRQCAEWDAMRFVLECCVPPSLHKLILFCVRHTLLAVMPILPPLNALHVTRCESKAEDICWHVRTNLGSSAPIQLCPL